MTESRLLFPATIVAAGLVIGLVGGGWLLGDGLTRARRADRAVTMRGLAERDVTADLATWSISTAAVGSDLAALQAQADADGDRVIGFLKAQGFGADEIESAGISVNQYENNGRPNITIRRRIVLRTNNVMAARAAFAGQAELMRQGVAFDSENSGGMVYSFTGLNGVKPAMIAAATKNARDGAEQFAKDSGTSVGEIRQATQGYFSIIPRDGENSGMAATASPFQKVRVVTTVDFYLK